MLPAGAVTVFPTPIFIGYHAVSAGKGVYFFLEKQQAVEEMTHKMYLYFVGFKNQQGIAAVLRA
jgi:hypothetical protein